MQALVFLIGPRGSGKTTVGGLLAARLNAAFADTDDLVVERAGQTIADIVATGGWASFRALENETLRDLPGHFNGRGAVVATGGGIVVNPENRRLLRKSGLVFFLSAPVDALCGRLRRPGGRHERPPLAGALPSGSIDARGAMEAEVRRVCGERDAMYRETAHYVVDAAQAADDVAKALHQQILHLEKP